MIERQIPELVLEGRRLGRHVAHDPRSRDFVAEQATALKNVVHVSQGLPFNQTRGSCTADALDGALNSQPRDAQPGFYHVYTDQDVEGLYDQEITLEGYNPATDDPGGTGLFVCQAARKMGLITGYRHAFGIAQALKALVLRPVITGVDWLSSFDQPAADGTITLASDAYIRGGHEFLVDELDVDNKRVGCWNSWGPSFGVGGRFYMSWVLWADLLSTDGDVTVPIP